MAIAVQMINRVTLGRVNGFKGFSWTTLFFGCFPSLMRGHVGAGLLMFSASLCTFGGAWLVFPFFYNSWHWTWLTNKGFVPVNETPFMGHALPTQIHMTNYSHADFLSKSTDEVAA